MQTLRVNNSKILTIKNPKFSGYYFYMNLIIWGDFQICISVRLNIETINLDKKKNWDLVKGKWINTILTDSTYPSNADYFAFDFETKNPNDLLYFSFSLLNEKREFIQHNPLGERNSLKNKKQQK